MPNVYIIAQENETASKLKSGLAEKGFACSVASDKEKTADQIARHAPDLVIMEMNGLRNQTLLQELNRKTVAKRRLPILAIASEEMLNKPDVYQGIDDFIMLPVDVRELELRARRLLRGSDVNSNEVIKCGTLTIDLAKCEVTVGKKLVELTYKEYELLKFLARDRGRVFTRETLLNRVWGYDYYGGDRTVDVHVRRLRSKIEASGDIFIETVRNIGYRFKKEG